MFNDVFRNRKIFVTGHTGFKGSWLCAWLLGLGARVAGFSKNIPTHPSNFEALRLQDKIEDYRGDVRNRTELGKALSHSQPEIVFHLAAQALVRQSYDDPVDTFETNMLGVMNILEECRKLPNLKAIVIITSDKCYRNEEWVWGYRESDRLGGADPYSASKGCAEFIAHSYFASFYTGACHCATARAGNVIGGGDWARDRIVPDCAQAWSQNRPVEIRSPQATRPWQHVLEPLSGYLWLAAKLFNPQGIYDPAGQSYNFGPPADIVKSVAQVVKELGLFWHDFRSIMDNKNRTGKKECGLLKLCCDKALLELDWKATLTFEETIRYTAEWYARYYAEKDSPDMWNFTQGQIAAYINAAQEKDILWSLT